jgi:hypothetical protein
MAIKYYYHKNDKVAYLHYAYSSNMPRVAKLTQSQDSWVTCGRSARNFPTDNGRYTTRLARDRYEFLQFVNTRTYRMSHALCTVREKKLEK